jgi:hypothetical protein
MQVRSSNADQLGAPWGIEELIAAAERIMASRPELFVPPETDSSKELNIRLVRDYVVREFIPRPERVGRESRFDLDHLVHLLAVRMLLRTQKWSLPAIKASFRATSTNELLGGILQPVSQIIGAEYEEAKGSERKRAPSVSETARTPELNPAQLLIQKFKAAGAPKSAGPAMARRLMSAAVRSTDQVAVRTAQHSASISRKVHVELEPWCEVVIDAQRMNALTREEVDRLGEALKSRLKKETAK